MLELLPILVIKKKPEINLNQSKLVYYNSEKNEHLKNALQSQLKALNKDDKYYLK